MLTLAMTTTTRMASVSLHRERNLIGEIRVEVARTHSTFILDQIDRLLAWTGKSLEDVENVIVSEGPGSFTGVRIGIAVVKGLFYGKDVKFYRVNELDALAYQGFHSFPIIEIPERKMRIYSLIDSGKEKIYYSVYEGARDSLGKVIFERVEGYEVCRLDALLEKIKNENKGIFIIGDGVINYREKILQETGSKVMPFPDENMKIRAAVFMEMLLDGRLSETDIFQLKPDYLEKSQAERDKR